MEEQPKKLQPGAWDAMNGQREMVKFEIDKARTLLFQSEPLEKESTIDKGKVYYIIEVLEDNVEKVIMTNAFTLLNSLKTFAPIKGKEFVIKKTSKGSKQVYTVVPLDQ